MMTITNGWMSKRNGFSLMEIILATAILAASGAALLGLIGQASRFALNAEQRTIALMHAEALLGDYLATPSMEMEGTVSSAPEWSYKIETSEISLASSSSGGLGGASVGGPSASGASIPGDTASLSLQRVEVSVFGGGSATSSRRVNASSEAVPVVSLVRWVRASSLKRTASEQEGADLDFSVGSMLGGGS